MKTPWTCEVEDCEAVADRFRAEVVEETLSYGPNDNNL